MHAMSARFAAVFHAGYAGKMMATGGQNLAKYREHRDLRFQTDFVRRLRVAVRLNVARAFACHAKGRLARAERAAWLAGGYYADYRKHLRQLRAIGGVA